MSKKTILQWFVRTVTIRWNSQCYRQTQQAVQIDFEGTEAATAKNESRQLSKRQRDNRQTPELCLRDLNTPLLALRCSWRSSIIFQSGNQCLKFSNTLLKISSAWHISRLIIFICDVLERGKLYLERDAEFRVHVWWSWRSSAMSSEQVNSRLTDLSLTIRWVRQLAEFEK